MPVKIIAKFLLQLVPGLSKYYENGVIMSVIMLTTGVPGCGKTYVRAARFLVDDFLINTRGVHYSNFPLNVDVIADEVSRKMSRKFGIFGLKKRKVTPEDIKKRIVVIPDEVLQSWRMERSGPWDYFAGVNLKYAHIAIDEIHNFLSPLSSLEYVQAWNDFLGEVRHRGCTFEGLTQDVGQVSQVLKGRAAVRLELVPGEDLRDPYFKIKMLDWYNLKAAFTGSFHKTVIAFEKRKLFSSWKVNHSRCFLIVPEYFKYYNSFNASLQEKAQGEGAEEQDRTPLNEYQQRGKISLLCWFFRRNWVTLTWRTAAVVLGIWLCFFGGISWVISDFISSTNKAVQSNMGASVVNDNSVSEKVPAEEKTASASPVEHSLQENKMEKKGKKGDKSGSVSALPPVDPYKPAMFFDGCCWLRNGQKIDIEYEFKEGIYAGKKVAGISEMDRYYCLDDGTVIHMY